MAPLYSSLGNKSEMSFQKINTYKLSIAPQTAQTQDILAEGCLAASGSWGRLSIILHITGVRTPNPNSANTGVTIKSDLGKSLKKNSRTSERMNREGGGVSLL